MGKAHTYREGRSLPAWASLILTLTLLALGMILAAGLAYAQTGSISGTVTYYGGLEPGTFHLNVDYGTDPYNPSMGGINIPGSGSYALYNLPDDTYYVCVSVDAGPDGGPYTCYDPDGDGEPNPIVVVDGGAVAGIDISLGGPWHSLGGPIAEGGQVNALVVHPAIADTVYAAVAPLGAYDSGPSVIYKTTDGAASWTPVYTVEHQVYSLATAGTTVYAGALNPGGEGPSIYASHDSGLTWAPVLTATDRGVWLDIAVHPTDPSVAIIGGWFYHQVGADQRQNGMVYRTDDAGLTWTPILTTTFANAEDMVLSVLIHPITPTIMLASARHSGGDDEANSYLYRSDDGGATWPISITIADAHIQSLLGHPSDAQTLYAASGWGQWTFGDAKVFRSGDAGLTWTEVLADAGGPLVFEPPSTVYTRWWRQIWASPSNGEPGTWTRVSDIWNGGTAFDIDLGPVPPVLYAGGEQKGVFKGVYDGANWNWELRNNGIWTAVQPVDIDVDPRNPDKIFAAGNSQWGWLSMDGGQTWTKPTGLPDYLFAFAIHPDDSDIVYAGGSGCSGVERSQDGGLSFETVYSATHCFGAGEGYENFRALEIAQSMPTTVYAGGEDNPSGEESHAAIVRSLDDGASWTEVFTLPSYSAIEALAINPADSDVVYGGGQDCSGTSGPPCVGFVYRTSDGGDSWDLTLVTTDTVRSIVIDRWRPDVLYVADDGYWVRKSIDGGDSWAVVRPPWWVPPNHPSGRFLAIDPNVADHVYLGGWGYIAETTDGGATWSEWDDPLNQDTPEREPSALAVDNGTVTQTLYAGFAGVWAHSRQAPQPWRVYLPLVVKSYTP